MGLPKLESTILSFGVLSLEMGRKGLHTSGIRHGLESNPLNPRSQHRALIVYCSFRPLCVCFEGVAHSLVPFQAAGANEVSDF